MQIKPREVIVSLNPYSNGIYNLTWQNGDKNISYRS